MALTSPSFTVNFQCDNESAQFFRLVLTDTTDYASEGIDPADVIGYFNIQYPDGTYHLGNFASPDIDGSVSLVYDDLDIPTDSNGELMQGTYTFSYYIRVAGAVQPGDYENTGNTYNFCPCLVTASLVEPIRGAVGDIDVEVDCFCLKITATDDTDVCTPTTDTRVFSLYPPPSLGLPTYTTNSATLTYNFQYTGGYEINLNRLLTYVTGIFTYTVRIDSSVYENVQCDRDLCALVTCYNTYRTETLTRAGQYGGFQNLSKTEQDLWFRIVGGFLAHDYNLRCGNYEEAGTIYTELKTLLKCDCSCAESDAPQLVNPYCSGSGSNNSITVVAAGAGITVSSVVVGDTTTYTVAVQQSLIDQISTNTTDITNLTTIVDGLISGGGIYSPYKLLFNDVAGVGTDANLLEKTLMAYTTTGGADYVAVVSKLKIRAVFTISSPIVATNTCRLYFGSYVVTVPITDQQQNLLIIELEISRKSAVTQQASGKYFIEGLPAETEIFFEESVAENLLGAILIKATGQNGFAAANIITCEELTVEYIKRTS